MQQPQQRRTGLMVALLVILGLTAGAILGLLIGWVVWPVSYVDTSLADLAPEYKEEYVLLVAYAYTLDGDLEKAEARLAQLEVPNINQSLSALIDRYITENREEADLRALVALADGLGVASPKMLAYLATSTPVPTDTPLPSPTPQPTDTPTLTPIPPTDTATTLPTEVPPTATPLPQPTDTVAVPTATRIPPTDTPRPQPTNTPRPTNPPPPTNTPQPTKPPAPGWSSSARLVGPGEDAQRCDAGSQQIRVTIVDASGNQLPGVWVHELYSGLYEVSGHKADDPYWGPGDVEISCAGSSGAGGVVCIADGPGGSCISAQTRGMSCWDMPPIEDLFAAGYCECCDVGATLEQCRQLVNEGKCMGSGHYSWRVVFKRSW